MKAAQVHYEGRVQGVGFRWTVKNIALGFDVRGSVRNLSDGRVELVVAAEKDEMEDFLTAIRESALAGHITSENKTEIDKPQTLQGFQIIA